MGLLHAFVAVARSLTNPKHDGAAIRGGLPLTSDNLALLRELVQAEVAEDAIVVGGRNQFVTSIKQADPNSTADVQLIPLNLVKHGYEYLSSLRELVQRHPVTQPPYLFYVAELGYFSDQPEPEPIRQYHATEEFIGLLKSVADYWVDRQPSGLLVFLQKAKHEVLVEYRPSDLVPLPNIQALVTEVTSGADIEQRKSIFKAVIAESLAHNPEHPFIVLLRGFSGLLRRYRHGYDMYLANFSWEKLKSELDREKIEFVKKVNATVTDIQTKVIALPAAFLLIATQMKHTGKFDVSNLLICIAGVIFGWLICLLVKNQLHALTSINGDINRLRVRVQSQDKGEDPEVKARFDELDTLSRRQKHILWWTFWISLGVPILSMVLFGFYTFTTAPKIVGP